MASMASVNVFIVSISKRFFEDPPLLFSVLKGSSDASKFHPNKSSLQNMASHNSAFFL